MRGYAVGWPLRLTQPQPAVLSALRGRIRTGLDFALWTTPTDRVAVTLQTAHFVFHAETKFSRITAGPLSKFRNVVVIHVLF